MISFTSNRPLNDIARRCVRDDLTQLRLKYNPFYRNIENQKASHIWVDGREMIMLSNNDYLGLSEHPKVVQAGRDALRMWGSSSTGSRFANGSRSYHLELEEKLADFLGVEACLVSIAGYISCMAAVASFAERGDLILVDRNVHSSLWSGITLSGARVERFGHNNPADLQDILTSEPHKTPKMLVIEGIYSMEGHLAKLPELLAVTSDHNCFIVIDDAHGFGVLGPEGRGSVAHFGATDHVDIIAGSMSKSLSSTGGYICGSRSLIEYLKSHSKQTIFSAALSPCQAACAQAALEVMQDEPEHRERLWKNTKRYHRLMKELGLDTWGSESPAVPIVLGSIERVYRFWKYLYENGIFTVISIPPAVPPSKELVRTAISASHTGEDLDRIAEAMAQAVKRV